ncbi:AI-2E family transporter [Ectothiorhodospiraceae bacterium 2226]|nr:AI-2E family transporter [Ectothiorhodospiraceae bacterium 2226]
MLVAIAIGAGALLAFVFLHFLTEVLLLVFAGVLVAILLRGLADLVADYTPASPGWALALVLLGIVGAVGGTLAAWGPAMVQGTIDLIQNLPEAWEGVSERLAEIDWLQGLMERGEEAGAALVPEDVVTHLTGIFSTLIGAVVGFFIILFTGIYLSIEPRLYTQGILHLVPRPRRARACEVLLALRWILQWWLLARLMTMTIVGVLTWIGLLLLGVPMAGTLGLLSGALTFVPTLGPIVAAIPAILLGLAEDPITALWVVGLYIAVQNLEGYIITPLVERRIVSVPPALLLVFQLVMALWAGILGLLLATPVLVTLMVLIKMLYVEDALGDDMDTEAGAETSGEEDVPQGAAATEDPPPEEAAPASRRSR